MSIVTERDAKRRMRELVWRIKEDMSLKFQPRYHGVNDPVAKHLEIEVKEQDVQFGEGGMYIPGESPKIVIDPRSGEQERLNFSFFHEVSHHLIRMDGELYGFLDDHSPQDLHPTLERYCHIGAAEFLVPEGKVRKVIGKQGFSIELIRELDEKYPASKPAIAIQLAQCATHQCIVVVCNYGVIPQRNEAQTPLIDTQEDVQSQLFVQYSSSSPSCKYTTGRFVPIPKGHLLANSYEQKSFLKGCGDLPVRSGKKWPNNCEAFFYRGKVYAVFNLTDPPSSNQMSFEF